MKITTAILGSVLLTAPLAPAATPPADLEAAVLANHGFAADLYQILAAEGATADEMRKVLHVPVADGKQSYGEVCSYTKPPLVPTCPNGARSAAMGYGRD